MKGLYISQWKWKPFQILELPCTAVVVKMLIPQKQVLKQSVNLDYTAVNINVVPSALHHPPPLIYILRKWWGAEVLYALIQSMGNVTVQWCSWEQKWVPPGPPCYTLNNHSIEFYCLIEADVLTWIPTEQWVFTWGSVSFPMFGKYWTQLFNH